MCVEMKTIHTKSISFLSKKLSDLVIIKELCLTNHACLIILLLIQYMNSSGRGLEQIF